MLRDKEERESDTRRLVSGNVRRAKDWQDVTAHKATSERKGRWMQECWVVVRVVVDRTSHMLLLRSSLRVVVASWCETIFFQDRPIRKLLPTSVRQCTKIFARPQGARNNEGTPETDRRRRRKRALTVTPKQGFSSTRTLHSLLER
jgi:hypothetical protein